MIVCLEGIDASGKATQAKLLANRLHAHLYSFPDYSSRTGRLIAQHLQREWYGQYRDGGAGAPDHHLNALVFQALMLTNRMELAPTIMRHRLNSQDVVLDRYWPSGVVYGGADGIDLDYLIEIHKHLPQAHHYVLLDVDPEVSAQRRPERADRYEQQEGLMAEGVERYRELWAMMRRLHSSTWQVVSGIGSIEEVEARIWAALRVLTPKSSET